MHALAQPSKSAGRPRYVIAVSLVFACTFLVLAPPSTPVAAGAQTFRTRYFVEFLARPTEYGVDHAFVQIGETRATGRDRIAATLGFFPAGYPDIGLDTPLINTVGHIRQVPEDSPVQARARHRAWVSAAVFMRALAHARWMRRHWHVYDLLTHNCNAVLFEFADRLGLHIPHAPLDQSANLVAALAGSNPPRMVRTWKVRLRHEPSAGAD